MRLKYCLCFLSFLLILSCSSKHEKEIQALQLKIVALSNTHEVDLNNLKIEQLKNEILQNKIHQLEDSIAVLNEVVSKGNLNRRPIKFSERIPLLDK